ncbi:MAG TPA: hypothetical protein V6C72_06725 [Chroococcales cyanobacterium]
MNDPLEIIHPEKAVRDQIVSAPVHFQMLHKRRAFILTGLALLAAGQGALFLYDNLVIAVASTLIEATAVLVLMASMVIPCRCGKITLAHRSNRAHSVRQSKTTLRRAGIAIFAIVAVSIPLLLTIQFLFGEALARVAASLWCQLFGLLFLTIGSFNVLPLLPFTTKAEVTALSHASGETVDELHQLIDFHLKAGNLDLADTYSKQLLLLSDGVAESSEF